MKKFLMALAVLALASAPAFAGPNAGGTLVVHDTGLTYTIDSTSYPSPAPDPACEGMIDANIPVDFPQFTSGWVWKVYAAFPATATPRLKALALGEQFGADVFVLTGGLPDAALDFDIPQGGWPGASGGADGISFGSVKTTYMTEVYWFGGYGYAGGIFAVVPHPIEGNRFFIDDSTPPVSDPIEGYSTIGFGVNGDVHCPNVPTPGACCFAADGHCEMLFADACIAAGGTVYGGLCDPNPCPPPPVEAACCVGTTCIMTTETLCVGAGGQWLPGQTCDPNPCGTPVEETSWGQIKANYR